MIHEVGVNLLQFLQYKKCPFPVIDGPEIRDTTTYGRERIVIEHDFGGGDAVNPKLKEGRAPHNRFTRVIGCQITIYAKARGVGSPYWEHVRRAEQVLDLVLVGLYQVASARQNVVNFKSGKFFFPPDLKDSETHGGAAYRLFFTFDRGVTDLNWVDEPAQTVTVTDDDTGVTIANSTTVTGATQDGGTSTELAAGTGDT